MTDHPDHSDHENDLKKAGDSSQGAADEAAFVSDPLAETLSSKSDESSLVGDKSSADVHPTSVGRYRISRKLDEGGFGAVYLARDEQLRRDVAVKVTKQRTGQRAQELFLEEARRLARLEHPNIVTVHDVGVEDGQCFIISTFLTGTNLHKWMQRTRPSWRQAAEIVAAIADALAHAHANSTIHRDIKPGNVIVTDDGKPVLVDFGLALTDSDEPDDRLGTVEGTPAYMSPEQIRGRAHTVDGRTDIYSLGVVLYHMLCGRCPFRGQTLSTLGRQIIEDDPQPPRQLNATIPPELEQICLQAMAKDPNHRFTTAADFAAHLRGVLQQSATDSTPVPDVALDVGTDDLATSDLVEAAGQRSSRRRSREAERRQVTVLFCSLDLESADEFAEMDMEEQHELSSLFQHICDEVSRHYDGTTIATTGDDRLICFGYPVGHEDAAQRAVYTGLQILQKLRAEGSRIEQRYSVTLPAIATVHTALSVVSESENFSSDAISMTGEARVVAARMAAHAEPNVLLITESTYRLVKGFFETQGQGKHKLKGAPAAIELFHVTDVSSARTRVDAAEPMTLTPLVGRDTEVSVLKDRWEDAVDASGQVVLLIGEAGLGKSRLVHVIRQHVRDDESTQPLIIEWRCSPYHATTGLYSATEYFESTLEFERDDSPEEKLDRLTAYLHQLKVEPAEETVPLLASMLSLSCEPRFTAPALTPQARKDRTLAVLLEWLKRSAAGRPVLFVLEDLHWVDPTTLEFIASVVDQTVNDRIMTLLSFRPEFETPWGSRANQSQIALHRLRRRQIAELMKLKTGFRKIPDFVVDQIEQRTDGIPLFVEEFTRVIQESGGLLESADGVDVTASFSLEGIPATLQDLLIARLDRMDSDQQVVQIGATIGRDFSYELLRAVTDLEEAELKQELNKLTQGEIIFERGNPPESTYTFKHALIQDAAYGSLLKKNRLRWHLKIAEVLESKFPETSESQPGLLARHFTEAGQINKSIEYWLKAGQRSQARFEVGEAISHLSLGLDLVRSLDESPQRDQAELGFLLPLGTMLVMARGYAQDEVGQAFAHAQKLCRRIGPAAPLFHVTWGNWVWRLVRNEQVLCEELAAQLMDFAKASADDGLLMEALFTKGLGQFYLGEFSDAVESLETAASLYSAERCAMHARFTGQNCGPCTLVYLALSYWQTGKPDRALQTGRNALILSYEIGDPFSTAFTLYHFGWLLHYLRLGEEITMRGQACQTISAEQGFPIWEALGVLNLGAGPLLQGGLTDSETDGAFAKMKRGIEGFHATGAALHTSHCNALFAGLLLTYGRLEDARRELQFGFETAERCTEVCDQAELHRVHGELLLTESENNISKAEAAFEKSREIATKQGALSWQLRTALSLARLRQKQQRVDEGRELLGRVVAQFSEGFQSADLMDAARWLQETV